MSIIDILKPIPEHLRGKYDVVHVGLIVLVVEKDDPRPILDNLLDLLSMDSLTKGENGIGESVGLTLDRARWLFAMG